MSILDNPYFYKLFSSFSKLKKEYEPIGYHYTSIGNFQQIIENKLVFATRYDCLNDYKERKDVLSVLKSVFSEYEDTKLYPILMAYEKKMKNIDSYSTLRIDENNKFQYDCFTNPQIFVMSCCQDSDNWLMWNAYIKGDKKEGVAIGFAFDPHYISKKSKARASMRVFPMIYEKKDKEDIVRNLLDEISQNYNGSENDNKMVKEILDELIRSCQDRFKDEKFKEEREVRIQIVQDEKAPYFSVKYRKSGCSLVPYIEFDFRRFIGEEKFLDIITSPFSMTRKEVIKEFLDKEGFTRSRVSESKIPIRKE